jgi:hypothetical protein
MPGAVNRDVRQAVTWFALLVVLVACAAMFYDIMTW